VTRGHLVLGLNTEVLRETQSGIEVLSRVRLRPGFMVHVLPPPGVPAQTSSRPALVVSWWIRAMGSDGPTYRGFCKWDAAAGPALPVVADAPPETHGDR
jgi:hypothetical protein